VSWSLSDHLLAHIADANRGANWQRGGGKGSKPKPIPRPGTDHRRTVRHGHTDRSPAEVAAYLAQFSPTNN
jgi:hypothetical protein